MIMSDIAVSETTVYVTIAAPRVARGVGEVAWTARTVGAGAMRDVITNFLTVAPKMKPPER